MAAQNLTEIILFSIYGFVSTKIWISRLIRAYIEPQIFVLTLMCCELLRMWQVTIYSRINTRILAYLVSVSLSIPLVHHSFADFPSNLSRHFDIHEPFVNIHSGLPITSILEISTRHSKYVFLFAWYPHLMDQPSALDVNINLLLF